MSTLETRWGGSASEMAAFLRECRSAGLDAAKLRALQAMVERDLGWLAGQDGDLAEADRHDLAAVELAGDGRLIEKEIYGVMLRTAGYDEERL